jgi:hypothetical protein
VFRAAPASKNGIRRERAYSVEFSSKEQFELHVHKCFGKIFELLMHIDTVIKGKAELEEAEGKYDTMCEVRDEMEEVILHCHLAWQYHRLSRMAQSSSTWDAVDGASQSPQE